MLIGNTKHIWRPFLEACSWDPSLLEAENPLETYVERTVTAIVDSALQGCVLPVTSHCMCCERPSCPGTALNNSTVSMCWHCFLSSC